MTKKAKAENVRKDGAGWSFKDPRTNEWTGGYESRTAARNARKLRVEAETGNDREESESNEQKEVVSATAPEVSSSKDNVKPVLQPGDRMQITLTKTRQNKGGVTLYAQAGVPANVNLPKSMFAAGVEAPASITITVEGEGVFALPGEVKVGGKTVSPENAEKIRANAEKAVARAAKATERANKAMAKAAKLAPAAPAEAAAATA